MNNTAFRLFAAAILVGLCYCAIPAVGLLLHHPAVRPSGRRHQQAADAAGKMAGRRGEAGQEAFRSRGTKWWWTEFTMMRRIVSSPCTWRSSATWTRASFMPRSIVTARPDGGCSRRSTWKCRFPASPAFSSTDNLGKRQRNHPGGILVSVGKLHSVRTLGPGEGPLGHGRPENLALDDQGPFADPGAGPLCGTSGNPRHGQTDT